MNPPDRPKRDVRFYPVDEGGVLFYPESQNLHALNGAAALIWAGLEEGLEEDEIVEALTTAGAPADAAPVWYRQTIEMLRLNGLLGGMTAPASPAVREDGFGDRGRPFHFEGSHRWSRRLVLAGVTINLQLHDQPLIEIMEQLYPTLSAGYPETPPGAVVSAGFAGGKWLALRDGLIAVEAATPEEIAGALEIGISQLVLALADYLIAFRGAYLRRPGLGLLLSGPSGSGKSMLAAGLIHRGWDYGCDERVLYRPGQPSLITLPKSPRLYRSGWPAVEPLFPRLASAPAYGLRERPARALHLPNVPLESARVEQIVFCRYRPGLPAGLERLARADGLQELFANCAVVRRPLAETDIESVLAWSTAISFHRLTAADLPGALDLLETLGAPAT